MNETLLTQVRTISSGTLATLTNEHNYTTLEQIRDLFWQYCKSLPQYWTWQEAWESYLAKIT